VFEVARVTRFHGAQLRRPSNQAPNVGAHFSGPRTVKHRERTRGIFSGIFSRTPEGKRGSSETMGSND